MCHRHAYRRQHHHAVSNIAHVTQRAKPIDAGVLDVQVHVPDRTMEASVLRPHYGEPTGMPFA